MIQKKKAVDLKSAISFKILPDDKIVHASQSSTLLRALLEAGVPMESSCGGMGTCGTCRLLVEKGLEKLGPRNEVESEFASDRSFAENERLTCQNLCQNELVLRRP